MKNLLALLLLIVGFSSSSKGGDKASGLESLKYFSKVIESNPSLRELLPKVEEKILELLEDEKLEVMVRAMSTYVQQVSPQDLDSAPASKIYQQLLDRALQAEKDGKASHTDPALDVSRTSEPEKAAALIRELLSTKVQIRKTDPCIDFKQMEREIATPNSPRATTCVYPHGLAILYLMKNLELRNLMESHLISFLQSSIWHETARKYDLDSDHEFPIPMEREMSDKSLVMNQSCWTQGDFCKTQGANGDPKSQISWAKDLSSQISAIAKISDKKGIGVFKWCNKAENFLVVSKIEEKFVKVKGWVSIPRPSNLVVTGKPFALLSADKKNKKFEYGLTFAVDQFGEVKTSASGRRNGRTIQIGNLYDFNKYNQYSFNQAHFPEAMDHSEVYREVLRYMGSCTEHTIEVTSPHGTQVENRLFEPRYLSVSYGRVDGSFFGLKLYSDPTYHFPRYIPVILELIERPSPN